MDFAIRVKLERLGYVVGERLAEGGQGDIYIATQHQVPCVLKVSKDTLEVSSELNREYVRLQHLQHLMPHARLVELRAIHLLENEKRTHLVTAWHRASRDLSAQMAELTRKGHSDEQRLKLLVGYIEDAAEGLAYLHAHGIIHRDIKPGNLFFYETDQRVRVGDIGLIKIVGLSGHDTMQPATIAGTFLYMSPEQLQGYPVPQSDLYSLALTYIHLRTGNLKSPLEAPLFTPDEVKCLKMALKIDYLDRPTDILQWARMLRAVALPHHLRELRPPTSSTSEELAGRPGDVESRVADTPLNAPDLAPRRGILIVCSELDRPFASRLRDNLRSHFGWEYVRLADFSTETSAHDDYELSSTSEIVIAVIEKGGIVDLETVFIYSRWQGLPIFVVMVDGAEPLTSHNFTFRTQWMRHAKTARVNAGDSFQRSVSQLANLVRRNRQPHRPFSTWGAASRLFDTFLKWKGKARRSVLQSSICPRCLSASQWHEVERPDGTIVHQCCSLLREGPVRLECMFELTQEEWCLPRLDIVASGVSNAGITTWLCFLCEELDGMGFVTEIRSRATRYIRTQLEGMRTHGLTTEATFPNWPDPLCFKAFPRLPRARSGGKLQTPTLVTLSDFKGTFRSRSLESSGERRRAAICDACVCMLTPLQSADQQRRLLYEMHADVVAMQNRSDQSFPPIAICLTAIDRLSHVDTMRDQAGEFHRELVALDQDNSSGRISSNVISLRSELVKRYIDWIWPNWIVTDDIEWMFGANCMLFPMTAAGCEYLRTVSPLDEARNAWHVPWESAAPQYVLEPFLWLLHKKGLQVLDP